jgi:hypothetical protein
VATRFRWWSVFVLSAGLCFTVARPAAAAASFALTPDQRDAAIRLGRQSVISEDFGGEWKVGGDGVGQTLVVVTPFHRLALAARNSAFKSEELKQKDIDALSKDQEGNLTLWATLKGGKVDFARFYAPVLVSGQQEIKATFVQNERTARREDDGSFTARCMYVFPTDKLNARATVTLIVKNSERQPVAKFTADLSAMR